MRAEADLAGAFQDFDALEPAQGRMRVRGVVAVGAVGQRQAVLEQEDLARPRGRQAANTDIGAKAQPLLIAREHARRLPQGFIDGEDAGFLEVFRFNRRGRSGNILEVLAFADHNHDGAVGFLGQRGGSPNGCRKNCEVSRVCETHDKTGTRRAK